MFWFAICQRLFFMYDLLQCYALMYDEFRVHLVQDEKRPNTEQRSLLTKNKVKHTECVSYVNYYKGYERLRMPICRAVSRELSVTKLPE